MTTPWDDLATRLVGEPRYTQDEVVARAGVSRELGDRLWAALALPRSDEERVFTDADVAALSGAAGLVGRGLVDDDALLALARSTGQLMGRLAETHVLAVRAYREERGGAPSAEDTEALLAAVGDLLVYVWRRQLAAAARGILATAPAADSVPLTVGFVDIVGYTGLSRGLSPRELSELLERFERLAADVLTGAGGRVVKTVGDAVLWVADAPLPAVLGALDLVAATEADLGLPAVRAGLATGPVLPRHGDVFGPVVNLASRLSGLARPGSVLVDREAARALRDSDSDELKFSTVPRQSVRGYEHLAATRVRRRSPSGAEG